MPLETPTTPPQRAPAVPEPQQAPRAVRLRRSAQWRTRLVPPASFVATVLLLELLTRLSLINPETIPHPSSILARLASDAATAQLWLAVADTFIQSVVGLAIGSVAAVVVGLLLGSFPSVERAVTPLIEFVRPIPSIAVLPMAILLLGVDSGTPIVLVSLSSFWFVLVMAIRGTRSVDPLTRDALEVFGLGPVARFFRLSLPGALPFIVTGVRIAGAVAIIVAITTGMLGGMPGVGRSVAQAEVNGDRLGLFAYLIVAGLLGLVVNALLERGERALLAWHPSVRKDGV